jgi:hypothetical protein
MGNAELERRWKEAVVAYFMVLYCSQIYGKKITWNLVFHRLVLTTWQSLLSHNDGQVSPVLKFQLDSKQILNYAPGYTDGTSAVRYVYDDEFKRGVTLNRTRVK